MIASKTDLMIKIETLLDEDLVKFFTFEYVNRGLTMRQISIRLEKLTGIKVLPGVMSRWFKLLGIPVRKLKWEMNGHE